MSKSQNIAAGCICYRGRGILIEGESGSGKSSLMLYLLEKGAKLVSDDRTEIFIKNNILYAKAPLKLKGLLEVRGIGIVQGFQTADEVSVCAVFHLTKTFPERLPEQQYEEINGHQVLSFSFYQNDFFLTNKALIAIKLITKEFSLYT